MEGGEASKLCAAAAGPLVQAMSKTIGGNELNYLADSIVITLTGLPPTRTPATAATAVTSLADGSSLPMQLAVLILVQNPPCRLSTEQLVELLKQPFCVGKARRVILDQLEVRYQREFPDHWSFVRFAQNSKLGLKLEGPPRP
jgi:hypothetical protein